MPRRRTRRGPPAAGEAMHEASSTLQPQPIRAEGERTRRTHVVLSLMFEPTMRRRVRQKQTVGRDAGTQANLRRGRQEGSRDLLERGRRGVAPHSHSVRMFSARRSPRGSAARLLLPSSFEGRWLSSRGASDTSGWRRSQASSGAPGRGPRSSGRSRAAAAWLWSSRSRESWGPSTSGTWGRCSRSRASASSGRRTSSVARRIRPWRSTRWAWPRSAPPHAYLLSFRLLELAAGDELVELGAGSGYGAALAAFIVGPEGRVITFEIDPVLAEWARSTLAAESNVKVVEADAVSNSEEWRGARKVVVTFAVDAWPPAWLEALPEGGRIVAPVGKGDQRLLLAERRANRIVETDHGAVRYVKNRLTSAR